MLAGLKSGSFFDPRPFLAKAVGGRMISKYREDQIVFSQEDPADAIFYIQKGALKVTVHSSLGKRAVVAILGTGDFFGEECLAGRPRRFATAAMMTSGSIVRIEKATMVYLLHNEPKFAELFVSYLAARKIRVEEDLVDQLLNSSEKRLARRLLLLAYSGEDGPPKTAIRLNQETLAAMVGTTQSRVSFFMNKFRRLGFIDYKGDLMIHSSLSTILCESAVAPAK